MKKIKTLLSAAVIMAGCSNAAQIAFEDTAASAEEAVRQSWELLDKDIVRVYDAPEKVLLNERFRVYAQGLESPVYDVRVASRNASDRWASVDDRINSHLYYNNAGFAYFDMDQPVSVTVEVPENITCVKVLPESAGIAPVITGRLVTFVVNKPANLTVEINEDRVESLHIFANPFETDIPDPNDPNVIYYGPGVHEVTSRTIGDNKTLYIAGGAVVKAVVGPDEPYTPIVDGLLKRYNPTFQVRGNNITIRGRGIIDATECPNAARNIFYNIVANNFLMEGIILQNPSTWTTPVYYSEDVIIDNIKILGYRSGTDGIDICNSKNVAVRNCFVRTSDDLIVIKTQEHPSYNECSGVVMEECVLWNQIAHPLSVGAEIVKPIYDITFRNCDVIRDTGREWSLRVFHTDNGLVEDITFENIRLEESVSFISLWINSAVWSTSSDRGNIRNVNFRNIFLKNPATGNNIVLRGYDDSHYIDNVLFKNVQVAGIPIAAGDIIANEYVSGVRVE